MKTGNDETKEPGGPPPPRFHHANADEEIELVFDPFVPPLPSIIFVLNATQWSEVNGIYMTAGPNRYVKMVGEEFRGDFGYFQIMLREEESMWVMEFTLPSSGGASLSHGNFYTNQNTREENQTSLPLRGWVNGHEDKIQHPAPAGMPVIHVIH